MNIVMSELFIMARLLASCCDELQWDKFIPGFRAVGYKVVTVRSNMVNMENK